MDRHLARVLAYAERNEVGCLISMYSAGSHGYAQAWDGEKNVLAHRLVWAGTNGPIPAGMTVDHTGHCNRKCIEITHLRLITNYENARRNRPDAERRLGLCVNGHSAPLVRRVRRASGRARDSLTCIECERERQRRYRAAKSLALNV